MQFLSWYYFVFIAITLVIYYSVNDKFKAYVLFFASLFFIAAFSLQVAIFSLLFTTINYLLGLVLYKYINENAIRIRVFWISIAFNTGTLAFFKYINFFITGIDSLFTVSGVAANLPVMSLIIPIGISYYTFQALGYIIRINRRSEKAETDFGIFATYLLFFPKFLSGPVERSNHFFPQMIAPAGLKQETIYEGMRLFLWGLFKKIVIANNLYGPVSAVYNDVHSYTGSSLLIVLLVQTIYIYYDFSGYTDMALGSAKVFGINLADNFNRPFLAKNISDFWRRWHISLSSWCNDFIYNPFIVKYRQFGNKAVIAGIFLTFFIVGIWHGANWTYVILGILQGVAIIYEFHSKKYRLKIAAKMQKTFVNRLSRVIVFLFMAFSMVFFFANSVADAWYFLTHLFTGIRFDVSAVKFIPDKPAFLFALLFFVILFSIDTYNEKGKNLLQQFLKQPAWVQWAGYLSCLLLIYIFNTAIGSFYYMRF
jgi:alginate O-acetyltransferase complex protein AlgI